MIFGKFNVIYYVKKISTDESNINVIWKNYLEIEILEIDIFWKISMSENKGPFGYLDAFV